MMFVFVFVFVVVLFFLIFLIMQKCLAYDFIMCILYFSKLIFYNFMNLQKIKKKCVYVSRSKTNKQLRHMTARSRDCI